MNYTTKTTTSWKEIDGYVVVSNTDLTEGRGFSVHLGYTESLQCARRLAKGKGVQGTDAYVQKCRLYQIEGDLYGPITFTRPTPEDIELDARDRAHAEAIAAARKAGLTDEQIEALREAQP